MSVWRSSNCVLPVTLCVCFAVQLLAMPACVGKTIKLPHVMSDFAISESSGDIATVSAATNRAYIFRSKTIRGGLSAPDGEVRVGDTPCAITFKKFGDVEMYAVVCTQDAHLYTINARTFALISKIPLAMVGVTSVVCSRNPDDPFLYYNYGSGHGSAVGAVDVRSMTDLGKVLGDSMDCAISADGKTVYRRGPWSPSGLESLTMTSDFTAEQPAFVRLFYSHRSTSAYVPDPFSSLVASGSDIYSRGLEQKMAGLPIVAQCFLRTRPVMIGHAPPSRADLRAESRSVTLTAISYNTFARTGSPVPLVVPGKAESLPRGTGSGGDFKRVVLRTRLLADELGEQVLYAFRDRIFVVPLAEFKLPDEPYLKAAVSTTTLTVGQPATIRVTPADPRVKLAFSNLPEGMTVTPDGLHWTAQSEHVGVVVVPVTLSFGSIQKTKNLQFEVVQPSTVLPFSITDFLVDAQGERAVFWVGARRDRFGQPERSQESQQSQIGVVSLKDASQIKTQQLSYVPRQVLLQGDKVVVLPGENASRVEIYDAAEMKRVKTLLSTSPLSEIMTKGDQLTMKGGAGVDWYDLTTFEKMSPPPASDPASRHSSPSQVAFQDGLLHHGTFFDSAGEQPQLLVSPDPFYVVGGAPDRGLYAGRFLRQRKPLPARSGDPRGRSEGTTTVDGPFPLGKTDITISLEKTVSRFDIPGSSRTNRNRTELSLTVSRDGKRIERVLVYSAVRPEQTDHPAMLRIADGKVYVGYGDRIYEWSAESYKQEAVTSPEVVDFHFVPRQAIFALDSGRANWKHPVKGGSQPVEFFWLTRLEGVTLDDKTGVVTADGSVLLKQAEQALTSQFIKTTDELQALEQVRTYDAKVTERVRTLLGREPKGVPMAVPIHLKAIDGEGVVAELQYFVLLEVDFEKVRNSLRERARAAEKMRLAMEVQRAERRLQLEQSRRQVKTPPDEIAKLNQRIDLLESKLDLLIEEFAKLNKQLEKR